MGTFGYFWLVIWAILGAINSSQADLQLNFYAKTCPKAEEIVQDYVHEHIPNAPSLAATLIRMHFHDCFVRVSIKNIPPSIANLHTATYVYECFVASKGL